MSSLKQILINMFKRYITSYEDMIYHFDSRTREDQAIHQDYKKRILENKKYTETVLKKLLKTSGEVDIVPLAEKKVSKNKIPSSSKKKPLSGKKTRRKVKSKPG